MNQRNTFTSLRSATLALVLPLALASCGGGSGGGSGPVDVNIAFKAVAGDTAVKCGTLLPALGSTADTAQLRDLRFYVSNAALIDSSGAAVPITLTSSEWQSNGVTLIALADGTGSTCGGTPLATNVAIKGTAPAGSYVGLQFELGVPESVNHTDTTTAAAPLNNTAMAWSWTAGRKFVKIEVDPTRKVTKADATTANSWFFHLGSTGCTVPVGSTPDKATCTNSNRFPVKLPSFDMAKQTVTLDLVALYAGSNIDRDTGGAVGCMSGATDADCSAVFSAMQVNFATGAPLTGGSTAQKIFTARSN